MQQKQNMRKIIELRGIKNLVNSRDLLLIIKVKINFSLGFDNTDYQTNKTINVHALHCTTVLYTVPQSTKLSQLEGGKRR